MTDRTHPDSGRIITSSDILLHDAETALMYEELRAAIDDGHESMTHADALAEISAMRAENAARLEIEALRSRQCLHGISEPSGWMPIETAPKDGTLIVLGARNGVWLGKYLPLYGSGYKPENPWSSMLLNHDHMAERYTRPTHWMKLPEAPNA